VKPHRLAEVEQKLALSEHVIGTMAKEICFRSEELAAIFRSTSELGRANDIETFSERLLNDLLRLTGADWFILRLLPKDGQKLILANASTPGVALPPVDLSSEHCAEAKAALLKKDILFDENQPLAPNDLLAAAHPGSSGLAKPIFMGQTILGTLAIGRNGNHPRFSADQIGVIYTFSEFLAIQIINIRLQQEHLDHRVTTRELEIARNIQQSLVPKHFPKLQGYGLSGFCLSARQVGGDFFDVLPLTEEKVLLIVADVMGKGVPAALFAATLHTLIRTMAEWTHRPVELLERVNRLIYDELSGVDMFITAQIVLADTRKRRLVVANAGHCPLLITRRDNSIEAISPEGMPLGILPDVAFEHVVVPFADCTSAVLYTDGLTEARNAHGEFFGQERLLEWLKQNQSPKQTALGLSEAFLAELKSFQGRVALSDDQTFLVLAEESEVPEIEPVPDAEPLIVPISARATASKG
jgi:serine phosphatase RsbU (regulator of sigma subunit)